MTEPKDPGGPVPPENASGDAGFSSYASALTASGKRIDFGSEEDKKRYKRRQKNWQDEAWRYYDECGEIWFAANFIANCLRKIRLFAAEQPDVSQVPIAIPDDAPGPLGDAVQNIERLGRADGGIGGIMAGLGLNLSIPGECVLVGAEDENRIERWRVCSADEVFINGDGKWAVRGRPNDKKGTVLDEETSVAYRIWRRHPRWSMEADSPMRPILDIVEELLILSRAIRASARSRLAGAGMLLWPSEASLGTANPATAQQVSGQAVDPVLADLMTAMLTPIGDEGTAAAVVPLLAKLPGERIAQVKHLLFDRPIDPQLAAQRMELLKRIANGLDIPAEILLGMQDSNHWTAWQIDEQTFKAHLEPLVIQICATLTAEFLRPNLGLDDPLESDVLVWYDASALIGHPNRTQDTKDAHKMFLLSDVAAVRYLGFNEEDMPSAEEIQARVARQSIEKIGVLRAGEVLGETTGVTAQEAVTPGIPATGPDAGNATTAAAMRVVLPIDPWSMRASAAHRARLGWRLAHRDRDLRLRLNTAADGAMFRALERAGSTLRRRASRDASVKAMLVEVPNHLVAARLGPELVLTYGVDTQNALEDAFDNLSMQFDRDVQRSQKALRELLDDMDSAEEIDMEDLAARQSDSRREAEGLLVVALTVLANQRLFNPHPEAPPIGEHDPDLLVPSGYLREALAVAGGTPAPSELDGVLDDVAGGVMTGSLAVDVWNKLGVGPAGYEWFTGAPDRPFDGHDLDGTQFESFDDEALAADPGEFPFVDHYFPGDHVGCQCDFAPLLEGAPDLEVPDGE